MSKLGRSVRRSRVDMHLTQGDLSQMCGAHVSLIAKIERGYIPANDTWLEPIGAALGWHPGGATILCRADRGDEVIQYDPAQVGKRYRRSRSQ